MKTEDEAILSISLERHQGKRERARHLRQMAAAAGRMTRQSIALGSEALAFEHAREAFRLAAGSFAIG